MRKKKVDVSVGSSKGFYIGDVCYVLSERNYHRIWGDSRYFASGKIDIPDDRGLSFAVATTHDGDGLYEDNEGNLYPVDAANIGIVPLELCDKWDGLRFGRVVQCSGEAGFKALDGVFDITLPDGREINIDTGYWVREPFIPHAPYDRDELMRPEYPGNGGQP